MRSPCSVFSLAVMPSPRNQRLLSDSPEFSYSKSSQRGCFNARMACSDDPRFYHQRFDDTERTSYPPGQTQMTLPSAFPFLYQVAALSVK